MKTSEFMTRSVVTVAPNATIQDAIRLMLGQRISGLPVVDAAGQVVGILTEGDLLRRAETGTEWRYPAWLNFLRGPARTADDFVRSHGRTVLVQAEAIWLGRDARSLGRAGRSRGSRSSSSSFT